MSTLAPLINLVVLMLVFGLFTERLSNILKLRHPRLRGHRVDSSEEYRREHDIQLRTMIVGILFAVLVKADLFSILTHLDAPWRTLGWVRVTGIQWFQSPATASVGTILYAVVGCLFTGVVLASFAKLWHDLLDIIFGIRSVARRVQDGNLEPDRQARNGDAATRESHADV